MRRQRGRPERNEEGLSVRWGREQRISWDIVEDSDWEGEVGGVWNGTCIQRRPVCYVSRRTQGMFRCRWEEASLEEVVKYVREGGQGRYGVPGRRGLRIGSGGDKPAEEAGERL